ncbi:hypothetical protein HMPREF9005_0059 [Actinomyces sp. oral taxon 178 str. F0338]|nr:hypothetical protein HMPREF9005_0059 [Actinomyces sp. oral taxon 178 str. F0338]
MAAEGLGHGIVWLELLLGWRLIHRHAPILGHRPADAPLPRARPTAPSPHALTRAPPPPVTHTRTGFTQHDSAHKGGIPPLCATHVV